MCVGVDCFGPFVVRRGRSNVKRYGVLFTCLAICAVHVKVAHSMDTESFINALRRFIARRGQPKEIRSDNGGNFVGGEKELCQAIGGWNQHQVHEFLLQKGIKWTFNPPASSHFGGVWERCIRTVRKGSSKRTTIG
jgi:transposase InsO family protein